MVAILKGTMFENIGLSELLTFAVILLLSISVHEMMHAFTAHKLGDPTAADEGRITLNPFAHIDPILTILLPTALVFMGLPPILAAKPVPFRPDLVRGGDWGAALVALAGPISNFLLAVLGAVVLQAADVMPGSLAFNTIMLFITLNVGLFVFNLIPFPPLDGSRVLYAFAPEPIRKVMEMIESFGMIAILLFILLAYQFISPVISNIVSSILTFLL